MRSTEFLARQGDGVGLFPMRPKLGKATPIHAVAIGVADKQARLLVVGGQFLLIIVDDDRMCQAFLVAHQGDNLGLFELVMSFEGPHLSFKLPPGGFRQAWTTLPLAAAEQLRRYARTLTETGLPVSSTLAEALATGCVFIADEPSSLVGMDAFFEDVDPQLAAACGEAIPLAIPFEMPSLAEGNGPFR